MVKDHKVFRVDSLIEELKLNPLKIEYLKGQKTLEGREHL